MSDVQHYEADLIIVGAGPGGYETAVEAARRGMKVIVVERDRLGGTCLNRGCIPTKAMCHDAATAMTLRAAGTAASVDFGAVVERRERVVDELRAGVATLLKGVETIHAEARFTPDGCVEADGRLLRAPRIIVATGSAPALPASIEGAANALTSDGLLELRELPASMVIVGGGVVGLEFASVFSAFGTDVTVVEFCPEILPGFDAEIAKRLRMALKRRGIRIMTSTKVRSIGDDGRVVCEEKGRERVLEAEKVVIAAGRRPVVPEGLAECGVEVTGRGVTVDDRMMTTREGIYAIGDVTGQTMLAHYATAQGMVALGLQRDLTLVPSAVFTVPECAMCGLTEQQCAERGIDVRVGRATFRANGKALAEEQTDGLVKVIAEASTGRLLGVHICGAHASDLIQTATVAIASGLTARALASVIFPHPTLSETLAAAVATIADE